MKIKQFTRPTGANNGEAKLREPSGEQMTTE